uniref:RNase H type-1 domain-containing protein n=1 Tax=Cannabis sativa TaxID=3483 RepID=A0A803PCH1_CANSA
MVAYLSKIRDLLSQLKGYRIKQIPREQNDIADALACIASSSITDKANLVPIQLLEKPSIVVPEEVTTGCHSNMDDTYHSLPTNRSFAKRQKRGKQTKKKSKNWDNKEVATY